MMLRQLNFLSAKNIKAPSVYDPEIHEIFKNKKLEQIYCCSLESLYKGYWHARLSLIFDSYDPECLLLSV